MHNPAYYRAKAAQARRLANGAVSGETADALNDAAKDFDDIAVDLENGAVEIRHPELMPQNQEDKPRRQG